jgi:DNA-binding GntR family transcriptional regulator
MLSKTPKTTKTPKLTNKTTLTEPVYRETLHRLRTGKIGPDDRIVDHALAREFDCTRTPVRQALLRLVNEGYLVGTTRGYVMPVLTVQDVRDIFEIRRLLEPRAAAEAATRLADTQLASLAAATRKCRRGADAADLAMMSEANIAFRMTWLEAAPNHRLKTEILRYADHTRQVRHGTMRLPGAMEIVVTGLHRLLEGFVRRDAALVAAAMSSFLDSAERLYFQEIEHA